VVVLVAATVWWANPKMDCILSQASVFLRATATRDSCCCARTLDQLNAMGLLLLLLLSENGGANACY
jgi:hypothetical protein